MPSNIHQHFSSSKLYNGRITKNVCFRTIFIVFSCPPPFIICFFCMALSIMFIQSYYFSKFEQCMRYFLIFFLKLPPYCTVCAAMCLVTELCPAPWDLMICSPPGSSVHGILQARILEWVAMLSSRGSFQTRDRTQVFPIEGRLFTIWATREAQFYSYIPFSNNIKYWLYPPCCTIYSYNSFSM